VIAGSIDFRFRIETNGRGPNLIFKSKIRNLQSKIEELHYSNVLKYIEKTIDGVGLGSQIDPSPCKIEAVS